MLRSLLVALDLSSSSDRIVRRVALLPLARDARLTLLHVVPRALPAKTRKRAQNDARNALEAFADKLGAATLGRRTIRHTVRVGAASDEIAKQACSVEAELVVMGRAGRRMLEDVFLGSTAQRVLRRGQLPVLVVRLAPRATYSRPTLAVALDEAADDAIEWLLRVIPAPRPTVTLVHAYEVPFHATIYPSLSTEDAAEYRAHYRHKAKTEITRLLSTTLERAGVSDEDAPEWRIQARLGSARLVIERAVNRTRADLLVLGTHGRAGLAHAFLGSVAGDVLREVPCDVLVVPPEG